MNKTSGEPIRTSVEIGAERSEAESSADERRGRPGRCSVEEQASATLELLSGKASIDQLARRFGMHPMTVEKWRQAPLEGMAVALRQGSGKMLALTLFRDSPSSSSLFASGLDGLRWWRFAGR